MTEFEIIQTICFGIIFLTGAACGFVLGLPRHHVIKWSEPLGFPKESGNYLCVVSEVNGCHSYYYQTCCEYHAGTEKWNTDLNVVYYAELPPMPNKIEDLVLKGIGHYCKNLNK